MANCVNRTSKEFKEFYKEYYSTDTITRPDNITLAALIGVWQKQNDTLEFPTVEQLRDFNRSESGDSQITQSQEVKESNKDTTQKAITDNLEDIGNVNMLKSLLLPTDAVLTDLLNRYSRPESNETIDSTSKKIELMQQGLDAVVIIDTSIEDSGQLLPANHPLTIKHGKPVIIINPEKLFSDTVFHEFGHLYIDLLGMNDPLIQDAMKVLRGSKLYQEVSDRYPELTGEMLDKEVLATALGLSADKIFKSDQVENLSVWHKIKNLIMSALERLLNRKASSLEKLAREMLSGQTRVSGSEGFNALVTQRSKYTLDSKKANNQSEIVKFLDTLKRTIVPIEQNPATGARYENVDEGIQYTESATSYIQSLTVSRTTASNGSFHLRFEAEDITKSNLESTLNNPKIPLALDKALNDFFENKLPVSPNMILEEGDNNWMDIYNRLRSEGKVMTTAAREQAELDALAAEGLNVSNNFMDTVLDNFDAIMESAQMHQIRLDQTPIVGTMVHKAIEEYINDGTLFPSNLNDTDNKLFNTIKNIIDEGTARGSVFRAEQVVFSPSKGIPGTIDLLEITADGKHRIYDYKTINSFLKKEGGSKSDMSMTLNRGYGYQLATYASILKEYGLEMEADPFRIIMIETSFTGVTGIDSEVTLNDVKVIDLYNKYLKSEMMNHERRIFKKFASKDKLKNLNIKNDIENLEALAKKLYDNLRTYDKIVGNMRSGFDNFHLKKMFKDLKKEMMESDTFEQYIAANNENIIKTFIEAVHENLMVLEKQKPELGDVLDSEYLKSLQYILQISNELSDIKAFLNENQEVPIKDRHNLLDLIDDALTIISDNKNYYADKTKLAAINMMASKSNLMYGIYKERGEIEANKLNLKGEEKAEFINRYLRNHSDDIAFKETMYWKNQYEDGFLDLRALEAAMADPGMIKSQVVQVVKSMLDKSEAVRRNEMMRIVPELVKWNDSLPSKGGSPKQKWGHMFRDINIQDEKGNKISYKSTYAITELTSDYFEHQLKYRDQLNYYNRIIIGLRDKPVLTESEQKTLETTIELKNKLNKERSEAFEKLDKTKFKEVRPNPKYTKLSAEDKAFLKVVKDNIEEADNRIIDDPQSKLLRDYNGVIEFSIPKQRMSLHESAKDGTMIEGAKSQVMDLLRPPADDDTLGITPKELSGESRPNLDIAGNEIYAIPVYYRQELEDPNLQSFDIPTLLALNHETTLHYRESKMIEADLFVVLESLKLENNAKIYKSDKFKNKKIPSSSGQGFQLSEDNNLHKAVKSTIENRLNKRSFKGSYNSKGNYRLISATKTITSYASLLALAGNFKSMIATTAQGSAYRFIEAFAGENFTMEDWKKGNIKTFSDLHNVLADTQKHSPESRTNLLIKKFGLEPQASALVNKFVQDNFAAKNLDSAALYSVTSIAEQIVTAQLMNTVLSNIKVLNNNGEYINADGKVVDKKNAMSLDEAYTVVDGNLVLHKDVVYTSNDVNNKYFNPIEKDVTDAYVKISSRIKYLYADLYGQYDTEQRSSIERTVFGRSMLSLRRWLPRGMHRRWRGISDILSSDFMTFEELRDEKNLDKRFYSQDMQQFQEGHYVTAIRLVRVSLKELKGNYLALSAAYNKAKNVINDEMTDHEIANLKRTVMELALSLSTMTVALLLKALAKGMEGDDEDKEKIYFAAYIANRVNDEIASFIYLPSLINMISTPAVGLSLIERVGKLLYQLIGVNYDKEEGWSLNITDEYSTGPKEGENKALIRGMNLVPGHVNYQQMKSILGFEGLHTIEDAYKNTERN